MRPDPHEGKYPPAPERVVAPGSSEHATWLAEQQARNRAYTASREGWDTEIGKPPHSRGR